MNIGHIKADLISTSGAAVSVAHVRCAFDLVRLKKNVALNTS